MGIETHALVQWQDATRVARVDRVLRVDISGYVMLIDIDDARAYPRIQLRQELEEAIALGEAILLEHDPYQHLRVRDDALKRQYQQKHTKRSWDANKRRRDQRWSVIAPIIEALEDVLFDSKLLGPLVQQAHERSHCSKIHVYAYLRAYWQGGECKNALLPRYDRCGAKGQARRVGTAKRGRPSKAVQIADLPPGINIDDRVKEYFRRGTKLYYKTQDKRSASRTLKEIKKHFFNVGFTYVDGHRTPVLPPTSSSRHCGSTGTGWHATGSQWRRASGVRDHGGTISATAQNLAACAHRNSCPVLASSSKLTRRSVIYTW